MVTEQRPPVLVWRSGHSMTPVGAYNGQHVVPRDSFDFEEDEVREGRQPMGQTPSRPRLREVHQRKDLGELLIEDLDHAKPKEETQRSPVLGGCQPLSDGVLREVADVWEGVESVVQLACKHPMRPVHSLLGLQLDAWTEGLQRHQPHGILLIFLIVETATPSLQLKTSAAPKWTVHAKSDSQRHGCCGS